MPTTVTSADDRRELIATSGIGIIARDGVRALTHRAVDREAGIPQGSTSYYAKTRYALLELIVDALARRALADARVSAEAMDEMFASRERLEVGDVADALGNLVEALAARGADMRARYALILELREEPELRDRLTTRSEVHEVARQVTVAALDRAGLPHDDARVGELVALVDALVFQALIGPAADPRSVLAAYLRGVG